MLGMYVPHRDGDSPDDGEVYSSMRMLWQNRDKHRLFIVACYLYGADEGLPALRHYCQNSDKVLIVDVHECEDGCTLAPDMKIVAHPDSTEIDKSVIIPEYQEKAVILDGYTYGYLVEIAKMEFASLEHDFVPIFWNKTRERLESLYGDNYYTK